MSYRGRFAPSPTGPLHFGSLVAALASYLDARAHRGQWLVRIEDLDPLREDPTACDRIVATLRAHGLVSDEPIRFQSNQSSYYDDVLARWRQEGRIYPCACSRKEMQASGGYHRRRCRQQPDWQQDRSCALRFRVHPRRGFWHDRLLGRQQFLMEGEPDDFIVRRKEGFHAYHLAVVTDDIDQGINAVVRGRDLLELTPFHLLLYEALGEPLPSYLHVPLVTSRAGQKLSKQTGAAALETASAARNITMAMDVLNHPVPEALRGTPVNEQLAWGIANWCPAWLGWQ